MSSPVAAASIADPTRPDDRHADLEGYRGLAAVGIVVFHAYRFCRGNASASYAYAGTPAEYLLRNLDGLVSLFFILSAYLLYAPLVRTVLDGRSLTPARTFLLRRAVRIVPLYWTAVLIVWAYRNPALPGDWRDLVEHLTFTQVFDSKRIFYTIGPAWSLSVEVFFYLFLAVVHAVLSRWLPQRASARVRTGILIGVPSSWRWHPSAGSCGPS